MKDYRRYEVEVEWYNDRKKFTVTDNYWDKSDFAFYNTSTQQLYSYSSVATNFVRNSFKGFEGLFSTIYSGKYCIYTKGIHGKITRIERV